MNRFNALALFLAVCLSCFGQSKPPFPSGMPSNTYTQTAYVKTDSNGTYQVCAVAYINGNPSLIPNVPVTVDTYTTQYSGYHAHEVDPNSGRPQLKWLNGAVAGTNTATGITGQDGCAYFGTQLPAFAGFYTLEVNFSPVVILGQLRYFPTKGINVYARETSPDVRGGGQFIPYPDNQTINRPQSEMDPISPYHENAFRRYLDRLTASQLTVASQDYANSTAATNSNDLISVIRGSLPDGGIFDEDWVYEYPGTWHDTLFEEHAHGYEVDIVNPAVYTVLHPAPPASDEVLLAKAVSQAGCNAGQREPVTGVALPDIWGYWQLQEYWHLACYHSYLPSGKKPH